VGGVIIYFEKLCLLKKHSSSSKNGNTQRQLLLPGDWTLPATVLLRVSLNFRRIPESVLAWRSTTHFDFKFNVR